MATAAASANEWMLRFFQADLARVNSCVLDALGRREEAYDALESAIGIARAQGNVAPESSARRQLENRRVVS